MFYAIATVFALFAILVLAKPILIPLSIALLISFILLPLAKKFETWKTGKTLAAFLSIFAVILIITGVIYFFSTQIISVSKQFTHFQDKIISAFADVTVYVNNNVSFVENLEKDELFNRMKVWITDSTGAIPGGSHKAVINTLLLSIVAGLPQGAIGDAVLADFSSFSPGLTPRSSSFAHPKTIRNATKLK